MNKPLKFRRRKGCTSMRSTLFRLSKTRNWRLNCHSCFWRINYSNASLRRCTRSLHSSDLTLRLITITISGRSIKTIKNINKNNEKTSTKEQKHILPAKYDCVIRFPSFSNYWPIPSDLHPVSGPSKTFLFMNLMCSSLYYCLKFILNSPFLRDSADSSRIRCAMNIRIKTLHALFVFTHGRWTKEAHDKNNGNKTSVSFF